jgi:hypothetical protein
LKLDYNVTILYSGTYLLGPFWHVEHSWRVKRVIPERRRAKIQKRKIEKFENLPNSKNFLKITNNSKFFLPQPISDILHEAMIPFIFVKKLFFVQLVLFIGLINFDVLGLIHFFYLLTQVKFVNCFFFLRMFFFILSKDGR